MELLKYKSLLKLTCVIGALILVFASCDLEETYNENIYELGEVMLYDGKLDSSVQVFSFGSRMGHIQIDTFCTVLAPTNEAWVEWFENSERVEISEAETFEDYFKYTAGSGVTQKIIDSYIFDGVYDENSFYGNTLEAISEEMVTISSNGTVTGNNGTANIVRKLEGYNGFIYVIDKVITGKRYPNFYIYQEDGDGAVGNQTAEYATKLPNDTMKTTIMAQMLAEQTDFVDSLDGGASTLYTLVAPVDTAMISYFQTKGYNDWTEMPASDRRTFVGEHIFVDEIGRTSLDDNLATILGNKVKYNINAYLIDYSNLDDYKKPKLVSEIYCLNGKVILLGEAAATSGSSLP